jgi:hypothetical protein
MTLHGVVADRSFRGGHTPGVDFAPRLDPRLVRAIEQLDRRSESIAEVRRRAGDVADTLGLARPSYERVRQLVHAHRRSDSGASALNHLLDVAFNARPADAVIADLLLGDSSRPR